MFRQMRRIKQQLAEDEALEVLKSAKRGVLSVIGDDGWPYGIHLNPYWEDGRLYFHGAKRGTRSTPFAGTQGPRSSSSTTA